MSDKVMTPLDGSAKTVPNWGFSTLLNVMGNASIMGNVLPLLFVRTNVTPPTAPNPPAGPVGPVAPVQQGPVGPVDAVPVGPI